MGLFVFKDQTCENQTGTQAAIISLICTGNMSNEQTIPWSFCHMNWMPNIEFFHSKSRRLCHPVSKIISRLNLQQEQITHIVFEFLYDSTPCWFTFINFSNLNKAIGKTESYDVFCDPFHQGYSLVFNARNPFDLSVAIFVWFLNCAVKIWLWVKPYVRMPYQQSCLTLE